MLVLENVKKSFPEPGGARLPILDIPRFEAAAGEQIPLVGDSGCGKTTLLHIIAGITRPDSGSVSIAGRDITTLSEAGADRMRAANIGYVFQTFNLLPGFTALENVMLGMTFGAGAASRSGAKELLDRVGLGHRLSHKPAKLSVGEQQRVAVARALVKRPRILLADEPTANVDPGNQQHIIDLIRQACREDKVTLLLVTHSREVSEQFDRIELMENLNRIGKVAT